MNWFRTAQARDAAHFIFSPPRYSWNLQRAGWWHPTLPPLDFDRHMGVEVNFHVTELLKRAPRFGLTKDDMLNAIVDSGRARSMDEAEDVYLRATTGNDHVNLPAVEALAMDKGWVKTSAGGFGASIKIEGNMPSLRAAMRSILESIDRDNPPVIEIIAHGGASRDLRRIEDMEAFARP